MSSKRVTWKFIVERAPWWGGLSQLYNSQNDFYELAQINGVEQHSKQPRKPSGQQWIFKKAERHIYDCCVVSKRPSNSFKHFLLVTLPCMNDMKLIPIHKELQSHLHLSSSLCYPESVNTKRENPMI